MSNLLALAEVIQRKHAFLRCSWLIASGSTKCSTSAHRRKLQSCMLQPRLSLRFARVHLHRDETLLNRLVGLTNITSVALHPAGQVLRMGIIEAQHRSCASKTFS